MFDSKELLILRILLKHHPKEMYGLEIVKESEGKLHRGVIYVHLARMEEIGEVSSREEFPTPDIGIPRKLYRLTNGGYKRVREAEPVESISGNLVPDH